MRATRTWIICSRLVAFSTCVLFAIPGVLAEDPNPSGGPEGWTQPLDDTHIVSLLLIEQLEYRVGDRANSTNVDGLSWIGGDYKRLWIEFEGQLDDSDSGDLDRVDILYGRLIAPFWDLQIGGSVQGSWGPGPDSERASLVVGLQGLAPFGFEVDTNLRVSDDGDVSTDFQASYDLLLTQRWVLQPRFETAVAGSDVPEFGLGKGLNSARLGLRVRYGIRRELAPYFGISASQTFGNTRKLARANQESTGDFAVVVGLRVWQ